jgi:hypothetical protein
VNSTAKATDLVFWSFRAFKRTISENYKEHYRYNHGQGSYGTAKRNGRMAMNLVNSSVHWASATNIYHEKNTTSKNPFSKSLALFMGMTNEAVKYLPNVEIGTRPRLSITAETGKLTKILPWRTQEQY